MSAPVSNPTPFALLAEFDNPAAAMHAAEKIRDAGFRRWDVHTPFPVHGMDDAMGLKDSKVGYFTFLGGITGFTSGMLMIWYMNGFDYRIVVGGKPLFSPLFPFPVCYELTILLSAFGSLFGMLFLNRLPRLYHPLLKNRRFAGATHDKFVIVVETADAKYSPTETRKLLEAAGSRHIEIVED
ncbi:MAG: DUF3341 domain-containing protein [Verrucomicrobia bacterium]|nr:DUF3341 domain-containing protein [Verrucomicrobiota bacterium]